MYQQIHQRLRRSPRLTDLSGISDMIGIKDGLKNKKNICFVCFTIMLTVYALIQWSVVINNKKGGREKNWKVASNPDYHDPGLEPDNNQNEKDDEHLPLHMGGQEKPFFEKYVHQCLNKVDGCAYLEWGTGGSTVLVALLFNISQHNDHIDAIEHYKPWCQKMQSESNDVKAVKTAILFNQLSFHCLDVDPSKLMEWGKPNPKLINVTELGVNYTNAIDNIKMRKKYYDLILIDGRYRVGCALKLIIGKYIDHNSRVIIHDYIQGRGYPQIVEKYYDIVETIHTIVSLKIKKNIDHLKLMNDFTMHLSEMT